jgi:hypothetical protein
MNEKTIYLIFYIFIKVCTSSVSQEYLVNFFFKYSTWIVLQVGLVIIEDVVFWDIGSHLNEVVEEAVDVLL